MNPATASSLVPAVEALSVTKTYPNGTHALQPVNLTVQEGEFVTLLGPSGCGKSTLLKMVAGLLQPSDGRLLLWRKPLEQLEASGHRLSFVFQEATLMPWARVGANVRLPLDLAGVPRARADARVHDALKLVGLEAFAGHLPRELARVDRLLEEAVAAHGQAGVAIALGGDGPKAAGGPKLASRNRPPNSL